MNARLLSFLGGSLVLLVGAARGPSAVPADLEVPEPPSPFPAGGQTHLFYELHITNFRAPALELSRVEIVDDDSGAVLAGFADADLAGRLARPGSTGTPADARSMNGGQRAVVFLDLSIPGAGPVPRALRHRLVFSSGGGADGKEASVLEGGRVPVRRDSSIALGPPLRGDRWVAMNGISNASTHRRTLVVVDGKARIAQRFATDWTRIGPDGQVFRGDPSRNANWTPWGAEVLAVGDASVSDVRDGIPENDPTKPERAVPITLETVGGNYVILDLGGGRFAFYAHLQPGSIRVRVGDRVKRGQVLALLGNSGNSDAPHLHFHVADANSPLGAEGLPYVLESFDVQGAVQSLSVLANGEGWTPAADARPDPRHMEMPVQNQVIRFN